jgi:hypothetical protein
MRGIASALGLLLAVAAGPAAAQGQAPLPWHVAPGQPAAPALTQPPPPDLGQLHRQHVQRRRVEEQRQLQDALIANALRRRDR